MVVNKMKATEIRKMSAAELEAKLADLKKDLFTLRKKEIARVKTILREKELRPEV